MQAYKSIQGLGLIVIGMLALMIVIQPMVVALAWIAPAFFMGIIYPVATQIDGAALALRLLTMVVFGYWIYAAGRNLEEACWDGLEYSAASRIWWFAVPFANFAVPYMAMRELWNASRGNAAVKENNILLGCWWALWLTFGIVSNFTRVLPDASAALSIAAALVTVPLNILAMLLVRGITHAQRNASDTDLQEIFA